jgi:hypothetical protein
LRPRLEVEGVGGSVKYILFANVKVDRKAKTKLYCIKIKNDDIIVFDIGLLSFE